MAQLNRINPQWIQAENFRLTQASWDSINAASTAAQTQEESTFRDYITEVSSVGLQMLNPELRRYGGEDASITINADDPEFIALWEQADAETKARIAQADNLEHAKLIVQRREVSEEAQERIANDPFYVQTVYGLGAALVDPLTYIPVGGVAARLNSASKLINLTRHIAEGAAVGASYGVVLEGLKDVQGVDPEYVNAGVAGALFGGTLQGILGPLAGPHASEYADSLMDTAPMMEFNTAPNLENTLTGIPKLVPQKQEETIFGKFLNMVPGVKRFSEKFLESDVTILMRSESDELRSLTINLASPVTAAKTADGTPIPITKTVEDIIHLNRGKFTATNQAVSDVYKDYIQTTGDRVSSEDFLKEVSRIYTEAANEQEIRVWEEWSFLKENIESNLKLKHKEELAALRQEFSTQEWWVREGKTRRPATPEDISAEHSGLYLKKRYKKQEMKTALAELKEKQRLERLERIQKELEELYKKHKVEFKGSKHHIQAAEEYRKYFEGWGEYGKKLGMDAFANIVLSKIYRPRLWNFEMMAQGKITKEELIQRLYKALAAHPAQAGMSPEVLLKHATDLATEFTAKGINAIEMNNSYLAGKTLPWEKTLLARKLFLDERELGDLIQTNLSEVAGKYSYRNSGRTALYERFGLKNAEDFQAWVDDVQLKLAEEGVVSEREIQAFEGLVRDLVGDRRLNQVDGSHSWANNVTAFNSTTKGGKFGLTTLVEMASVAVAAGLRNSLNKGVLKSFSDTFRMLFKGRQGDEVSQFLLRLNVMEEATWANTVNKFTDIETLGYSGRIEHTLAGMSSNLQKYNGMRFFQAFMERVAGTAVWREIETIAGKSTLSRTEATRLARWGLDHSTAKKIAKEIQRNVDLSEGRLNLQNWNSNTLDLFQTATSRAIREIVVQGDSIHLPDSMKGMGWAGRIFTQFMRFPMIAHTTLLKRGIAEEQARYLGGAVSAFMTKFMLNYLYERAQVQAGIKQEYETSYDFTKDDTQMMHNIKASFMYVGQLGMFGNLAEYISAMTTGQALTQRYGKATAAEVFGGPSAGYAEGMIKRFPNILSGDIGTREMNWMKTFIPYQNVPIISEVITEMIDQLDKNVL